MMNIGERIGTKGNAETLVVAFKVALIAALVVVFMRWTGFDVSWPTGDWVYDRLNLGDKRPAAAVAALVAS